MTIYTEVHPPSVREKYKGNKVRNISVNSVRP